MGDRELGGRPRIQADDEETARAFRLTYYNRRLAGPFVFNNDPANGVLLASPGGTDRNALQIAGLLDFGGYQPPSAPLTPRRLVRVDGYATAFARLLWVRSTDGRGDAEVASTSEEGLVKVFDVRARQLSDTLAAPRLLGLRELPSTPGALLVCSDTSLVAWDRRAPPDAARRVAKSESGARVLDVEAAPEGHFLFTSDEAGIVRVWDDRATSQPLLALRDNSEGRAVNSLQIDRTGTRLLATSEKGHASLIDLLGLFAIRPNLAEPVQIAGLPDLRTFTAEGYRNATYFRGAYMSPCGDFVVGGTDDSRGLIWSSATGRLLRTILCLRVDSNPGNEEEEDAPTPRGYARLTSPIVHVAMAPVGPSRPPILALSSDEVFGIWQNRQVAVALGEELAGVEEEETDEGEDGFAVIDEEDRRAGAVEEAGPPPEDPPEEPWVEDILVPPLKLYECAYGRGYVEQIVYTCLTCRAAMGGSSEDPRVHAGICRQCAAFCHPNHQVECLGRRGAFRCDCGNSKMPRMARPLCKLAPQKDETNPQNRYGHNFDLKYCICDGAEDPEGAMVQCNRCWDWFHFACIGLSAEEDVDAMAPYVCAACAATTCTGPSSPPPPPPPPPPAAPEALEPTLTEVARMDPAAVQKEVERLKQAGDRGAARRLVQDWLDAQARRIALANHRAIVTPGDVREALLYLQTGLLPTALASQGHAGSSSSSPATGAHQAGSSGPEQADPSGAGQDRTRKRPREDPKGDS
eukprot:tig00001127_g7150.t1